MAKSVRTFSTEWEAPAAKAGCPVCGRRVLTKDASESRYDVRTGEFWVRHAECMPKLSITVVA